MNQLKRTPLQTLSHQHAWDLQEDIRTRLLDTQDRGELLLVEHPPTLSMGRAEKGQNLKKALHWYKAQGFDISYVNRGGKVTYHGPGQLVVYPVINLQHFRIGIKDYVCKLEQTMIDTLAHFDIDAHRRKDLPGVYVDNKKIGSVGIHVRKFVSIHGIALNNTTDLEHFTSFTACGINNIEMTSIQDQGVDVSLQSISEQYQRVFEHVFDCQLI